MNCNCQSIWVAKDYGKDAIELGVEPIVYMREFMQEKRLSEGLVERVEQVAA